MSNAEVRTSARPIGRGVCAGVVLLSVIGLAIATYLTVHHMGLWRGQIESVRTARKFRGRGIGRALFEHAIAASRERGCGLVQLTTDKSRADAHAFYDALGFVASHDGMKLSLQD